MTIKKIKGNFKILGFKCVNCDKDIPWERLYKIFCSELCQEEAKYVRYHRKVIAEGRDKDPDIAAAIEVKRISIISGGYSTKDRKVPESLRAQVFKLSKNRCAICGKLGREVDHIKGSSNDIENLQLLCWD
ncbi:hypothetical protein ACQV5M_17465, partial [Leptospira sp. SA-E8]